MRVVALRYALAPACVLLAVLLYLSPAQPVVSPAGPFLLAVLAAAWFGGAGPGLLAAVLATLAVPQVVSVSYPLVGGFLDLPRFIVYSIEGLAIGWWSFRHRRVEAALRESYELAMNASDVGFWDWIPVGDKHYLSPRLREMLGFTPDAVIAGRAEMFERLAMSPEDRAALYQAVKEHFAGKTTRLEMDFRILVNDEVRWIHARGVAMRNSKGEVVRWNGAASDVTERKRAEQALRESEQRYELAMAASESAYWDWDLRTDKYFTSWKAYEMGGYEPGALVSREDFRRRVNMHPEDFAKWEAAREALFAGTGERLAMVCRYIVRGETRWHSLQAICKRDETGKVVRWTGSATDITERKRAEEGLKAIESKLRQTQRLEAMGTLAGGIAHDFNNILGAILGYGEMALRDAPKGSRLARDLGSIVTAGERGRALVERVLAFSRNAVGERVPVHVERVVRDALDLVSAKLPPDVTLRPRLHARGAAVLGDATQVHQVLDNLATNAVQAMPAGGTLTVELAVVFEASRSTTIGALTAGEYVVLKVADTGSGIAPEILDHVFDPFFTTKEVGTGTGLGLSLVHGIVTELGGSIELFSKVGAGTTFTVYLPRSGDAADAEGEAELELPRGAGQRVMVVDDEEPLVRLVTRTLEDLGYETTGFTSSAAALAAFRADPEHFDAVITDERMPGVSGTGLIREVRGLRMQVPIVLMSGFVGGGLIERAREAGADEVLKKPVSARDVATGLAGVLRK